MRPGYDQRYPKDCEVYGQFQYLWKTDDAQWIEKRKDNWRRYIEVVGGTPLNKYLGEFYVFGKEPASFLVDEETGERVIIKFEFKHRIAYMPFETVEQIRNFWSEAVTKRYAREQQHGAARYVSGCLDGFPERDKMVKMVAEALFNKDYFMLKNSQQRPITVSPLGFMVGFARVWEVADECKYKWSYICFTFDYFMDCVRYCELHDLVKVPVHKNALPSMYKILLRLDDMELSPYRLELKQKLIAAAKADDAPSLLREALVCARGDLKE
ncbi:hypothetical protein [uncultured Microbulbifer sp.]|uniref:hypothetical protein n=1 Tax=uncultured Microbulbifer sp. TaxID=348147 RepID=UPI00260A14E5|nr:hypothetical protein [uncultured Microbulbifer sp.]